MRIFMRWFPDWAMPLGDKPKRATMYKNPHVDLSRCGKSHRPIRIHGLTFLSQFASKPGADAHVEGVRHKWNRVLGFVNQFWVIRNQSLLIPNESRPLEYDLAHLQRISPTPNEFRPFSPNPVHLQLIEHIPSQSCPPGSDLARLRRILLISSESCTSTTSLADLKPILLISPELKQSGNS
jgi:hypothetical protein